MFKKTRVRQIIELLQKNLSDREISNALGVSRNSVARIRQSSDDCSREWDELLMMTDDELYLFFYPDKFKPKNSYAPVDYAYVHSELGKVGVTEVLLWEEYCEKCKKEGVKACSYHTFARGYKRYTVSRNYTSHAEHKPGVILEADWLYCNVHMLEFFEGSVGRIARKIIFETEEKPMLMALPLIHFEICEWSYNHKVGANSHIWFDKGQYSVPSDFLNKYVDVRYNGTMVYIYSSHKLIAKHKRLPSGIKNGKRTEASHLPYPPYTPETISSTTAKAEKIGVNTNTVVHRIYDNAKIKEQALMDVKAVLDIAGIYGEEMLEEACKKALKDFYMITYNTLIPYVKDISKSRKNKTNPRDTKEHKHGIIRGADYYRKDGIK